MSNEATTRRRRPPFLPIARWLIFVPAGPLFFLSSMFFKQASASTVPGPLVVLHYFSLLLIAVSIASLAVFLVLLGGWLCFMSAAAFERRISWWCHRLSRVHRLVVNAPKEDLSLEGMRDVANHETFYLLRTPFGDFTCYPDSALRRLLPAAYEFERRAALLDEGLRRRWRRFVSVLRSEREMNVEMEELESQQAGPD